MARWTLRRDREPGIQAEVLKEFVPLSKMMADDITRLQNWAKGRAGPCQRRLAP